jgi:hypothetical protein
VAGGRGVDDDQIASRRGPGRAQRLGDINDCCKLVDARRSQLQDIPHRLSIRGAPADAKKQIFDAFGESIPESSECLPGIELPDQQVWRASRDRVRVVANGSFEHVAD